MGYGGALIWTGMARNLHKQFPDKKIVLIYRRGLRKNSDLEIYRNNPDITLVINHLSWYVVQFWYPRKSTLVIDLNNTQYQYWISDTPEKIAYRQDGHAIAVACKPFDLPDVELKTRLVLEDDEYRDVEGKLHALEIKEKNYICIEPNAKKTFTANKQWPWEQWQEMITLLNTWIKERNSAYTIVQIGVAGSPVLEGVIDFTGTTSFRQLNYVVDHAVLVIANEGGVAHLAASTDTPAVIISNPSLPVDLMRYPQHTTVLPEKGHHNCGFKQPCPLCFELLQSITPAMVFEKVIETLQRHHD